LNPLENQKMEDFPMRENQIINVEKLYKGTKVSELEEVFDNAGIPKDDYENRMVILNRVLSALGTEQSFSCSFNDEPLNTEEEYAFAIQHIAFLNKRRNRP
jgi:hypothetical protein